MDKLNNREEIAEPEKMAQQSANITKKNRLILLKSLHNQNKFKYFFKNNIFLWFCLNFILD